MGSVSRPGPRRGLARWLLGGMAIAFGVATLLEGSTLLNREWSIWLARAVAISTLLVFAALGLHVLLGGAHETRPLVAMTLRSGFWIAQALLLPRLIEGDHRG